MIGDVRPNKQPSTASSGATVEGSAIVTRQGVAARNIVAAQQTIYQFLLDIVRKWPPEEVLLEFKRLFLHHVDSVSSAAIDAVYEIVLSNNETEFRNTLKRSCYILLNNWDATRRYQAVQQMVAIFAQDTTSNAKTISPSLSRLRNWAELFRTSSDYEDLKLFASRYDERSSPDADVAGPWINRYTSYLLVPQYINSTNPIEQRDAARAMAQQLRDKFKMDLAMYVAKSQSVQIYEQPLKNPTTLGDEVLRLIKLIVAKRGNYSHTNLANIFLGQTKTLSYRNFKQSLQRYLVFANDSTDFTHLLQTKLADKLEGLYLEYEDDRVSEALILRTANRMIDQLTTENHTEPSTLFVMLLSQSSPMTLVVTLLKLILISRNSRIYLEARIAELIRYYENYPEDECRWVVHFLEVFNVTFTIYAENVQYNLIDMSPDSDEDMLNSEAPSGLGTYRIFSQLKSRGLIGESLPEAQQQTSSSEALAAAPAIEEDDQTSPEGLSDSVEDAIER